MYLCSKLSTEGIPMLKYLALVMILLFAPESIAQTATEETKQVESDSLSPEDLSEFMERMQFIIAQMDDDKVHFSGLDTLRVGVFLDEDKANVLSEAEVRTKFEATLRKYRVPVDSDFWSFPYVALRISSVGGESAYDLIAFLVAVELRDQIVYSRGDQQHQTDGVIWRYSMLGASGNRSLARGNYLQAIEQLADEVANLYLSAN